MTVWKMLSNAPEAQGVMSEPKKAANTSAPARKNNKHIPSGSVSEDQDTTKAGKWEIRIKWIKI